MLKFLQLKMSIFEARISAPNVRGGEGSRLHSSNTAFEKRNSLQLYNVPPFSSAVRSALHFTLKILLFWEGRGHFQRKREGTPFPLLKCFSRGDDDAEQT